MARHGGATIQVRGDQVEAISAASYPVPAPRPANSRLDHRRLLQALGQTSFPHWQEQVSAYVQAWVKAQSLIQG